MTNRNFSIVFLGGLWLTGACASDSNADGNAVATAADCVAPVDSSCVLAIDDGSFVRWAGPVTDGVGDGISSAVVSHTPRKFCMSGTVDPGLGDFGWGALLLLGLVEVEHATGTLDGPLDASALGIKQLRFTLDTPPLAGLMPQAIQMQNAECKQIPECMRSFGLSAGILDPGTYTVPLSDFTQTDGTDPTTTQFDPSLVMGLQFHVPTLPGPPVPYDFCLRDIAFLDASGREVRP